MKLSHRAIIAIIAGALCTRAALEMVHAGDIPIASDVAVHLSANPATDLRPGDLVHFTISITNLGPEPVTRLSLESSPIYDELDVLKGGSSDCDDDLALAVADFEDSFHFFFIWHAVWSTEEPLAVGDTRVCYLTLPYTEWAPDAFALTFSMHIFHDLDEANNASTAILRRSRASTVGVPTLSYIGAAILAMLFVLFARAHVRRGIDPSAEDAHRNRRTRDV